jgi:hypothetical protein
MRIIVFRFTRGGVVMVSASDRHEDAQLPSHTAGERTIAVRVHGVAKTKQRRPVDALGATTGGLGGDGHIACV